MQCYEAQHAAFVVALHLFSDNDPVTFNPNYSLFYHHKTNIKARKRREKIKYIYYK